MQRTYDGRHARSWRRRPVPEPRSRTNSPFRLLIDMPFDMNIIVHAENVTHAHAPRDHPVCL